MDHNAKNERDYSLDFLKALSICLVMLWHMQPIGIESSTSETARFINGALDLFYLQISVIAVPVFILVSLFLFNAKISQRVSYFKKRFIRILSIYVFWLSIQFIAYYSTMQVFVHDKSMAESLIFLVMVGGPDLPFVRGSVFYYLFVLLALTAFQFLFQRSGNPGKTTTTSIVFIVVFIVYFELMNLCHESIPYWRLDNFLIYIPTSYLLTNHLSELKKLRYYFLIGFVVFTCQDILLCVKNDYSYIYGRASIYFGAVSLFLFAVQFKFKRNRCLLFLSEYSLGIFALHKFCWLIIIVLSIKILNIFEFPFIFHLGGIGIKWYAFIVVSVSIGFTFAAVKLLSLTKLKQFVS